MVKRSEFHHYLIRTIVIAFVVPILLFIALLKLGLDSRLNLLINIGIFCYLMVSVSLNTIKRYSKKIKIKKTN